MAKNIIVCSDGTANAGGKANGTNVWRLFLAIDQSPAPQAGYRSQIACHDDGVGTQRLKYLAAFSGAFGWGISRNLRRLYGFLIQQYEPGDDIYLFGFSRGAFTLRLLADMINKCGLPGKWDKNGRERTPTEIAHLAGCALRAYKWRRWPSLALPEKFKNDPENCNCIREGDTPIKCLGVWDTVDAIGLPVDELTAGLSLLFRLRFSNNRLSPSVQYALHALSIDDERHTFHPVLWEPADNIEQVWFAGMHANVGGGYPKDQLALVSLNWMIERATALETDPAKRLRFHDKFISEYRDSALYSGQLYDSRSGIASYYRYAPRRLDKIGGPTALTQGFQASLQKPYKVCLHASVLRRIYEEIDSYAPTAIPEKYDTVGDSRHPVGQLREISPEKRMQCTELAYDMIVLRRVLYYLMLFWTLWILFAGWVYSLEPVAIDRGVTASVLGVFASIFPNWLNDFIIGYQKFPCHFLAYFGVYLALWFYNGHLRKHMADVAIRGWHVGFGEKGPDDGRHASWTYSLACRFIDPSFTWLARLARRVNAGWQTNESRRKLSETFQWAVLPATVVCLVILVPLVRPVWNKFFDSELSPNFSHRTSVISGNQSRLTEFVIYSPMQPTGWKLLRGERYGIEVTAGPSAAVPACKVTDAAPWCDAQYPGSPAGLTTEWQGNAGMWLGTLVRRVISAPWFELRGVIAALDGEEMEVPIGKGTDFEAEITGELFLFVNDAAGLYDNNQGVAAIKITHWPRGRVPQQLGTRNTR